MGTRSRLTEALILKWMKAQFRETGQWPTQRSGPVSGEPGENWSTIDCCLRLGRRGLAGGSSLARLLNQTGLKPNRREPAALTIEEILAWLEADHRATGKWPTREGGARAPNGLSWASIDFYLWHGLRGLPGGFTLARLVRFHRNVLLRAHWILPVKDGQRLITTAAELTALLVTRGPLQRPDLLWSLRERQRKFQEAAARQGRRRRR